MIIHKRLLFVGPRCIEAESKDWSDHAFWWPETKTWLVRTRWRLEKYGVAGDSTLWFTPMHKNVRVTLPDLQTLDTRLNFSVNIFNNVIALCKKFSKCTVVIRRCKKLSIHLWFSPTEWYMGKTYEHIGRDLYMTRDNLTKHLYIMAINLLPVWQWCYRYCRMDFVVQYRCCLFAIFLFFLICLVATMFFWWIIKISMYECVDEL